MTPAAESCESPFDEDCDGAVNEGCTCSAQEGQSCYGGPAGTQGVGICHGGTVGCDLFGNVACQGQQLPRVERCATLEDDDCDGSNECQPVAARLWVPGGTRCAPHRDMAAAGDGSALVLGRDTGMQWSNRFVTKLDASGSIVWERSLPMPQGWDERELITVDSAGNALVAWRVSTFNGFGAISNLFVAKISPTGEVRWTQQFDGDTESWFGLDGITADVDGGLVIAGRFSGTLRLGGTEHSTGFWWRQFSYIAKFDAATGAPLWSKSKDDSVGSMVVAADGTGSVLWAGSLHRALTMDEVSLTPLPGGSDALVVKLDGGTGRASWGQRVGVASVNEGISRLKADGAGNLVQVARCSGAGASPRPTIRIWTSTPRAMPCSPATSREPWTLGEARASPPAAPGSWPGTTRTAAT